MTNTYIALNTITLATATSSVTFGSIPQTYRDLVLVIEASTTVSGVTLDLRMNGDASSSYPIVHMTGRSNGAVSGTDTGVQMRFLGNTFGTAPIQANIQLMDYSATDKHKTVLGRVSSDDISLSSRLVRAVAGRYPSNTAITSIQISSLFNARSWAIGSTFALYGIRS